MDTPKVCPVCGHDSIRPVNRSTLVKLDNEEISDVFAFRCGEGHFFLVAPSEHKDKSKSNKKD